MIHDFYFTKRMDEFSNCPNRGTRIIEPPRKGLYVGKSKEFSSLKDAVVQNIRTDLKFQNDGTIVGYGDDSIDGAYSLKGNWKVPL